MKIRAKKFKPAAKVSAALRLKIRAIKFKPAAKITAALRLRAKFEEELT